MSYRSLKKTCAVLLGCSQALNLLSSFPQTYTPPELDYEQIGDVLLAGDFSGISQIDYNGQYEMLEPPRTDGEDLIVQYGSDDIYLKEGLANGLITSSCLLGDNSTVVMVGNFTTVFNQSVPNGIAAVNIVNQSAIAIPNQNQSTSFTNMNGSNVNAVWCNGTDVYFGGSFHLNSSYGAGVWSQDSNDLLLPTFGGFVSNSTVNAIIPYNNSVVYGGQFQGISGANPNSTTLNGTQLMPGMQPVSFNLANATGYGSQDANGTDASSILCPMKNDSGWIAGLDSTTGYIDVTLAYTSEPTRIRLFNLADGSGTKSFRIISAPAGSFMNLTYTDVATGEVLNCAASCPLPEYDEKVRYTDFKFVNVVPTTGIKIQLLDFYGDHPGLNGIQLFEQGQHAFAYNALNYPRDCGYEDKETSEDSGVFTSTVTSNASLVGDGWSRIADFMATNITNRALLTSTYAQLNPTFGYYTIDRGQYEILLYTPGCEAFGTCSRRGIVNVTVYPGFGNIISTTLYQTNNDLKYDQVYNGTLQSGAYIRITPVDSNQLPMELVAYEATLNYLGDSKKFNATNLFEYLPSNFTDSTLPVPVGDTPINQLGYQLGSSVSVNSLLLNGSSTLLIGGSSFPANVSSGSENLMALSLSDLNSTVVGITGVNSNEAVREIVNLNGTVFALSANNTYIQNNTTMVQTTVGGGINEVSRFKLNKTDYWAFSSSESTDGAISLWDPAIRKFAPKDTASRISGHLSGYYDFTNITCYSGSLRIVERSTPGGSTIIGNRNFSESDNLTPYVLQLPNQLQKRDSSSSSSSPSLINSGTYVNSSYTLVIGKFNATLSDNSSTSNAILVQGNRSYPFFGDNVSDFAGSDATTFYKASSFQGTVVVGGQFTGSLNSSTVQNVLIYNANESSFIKEQQPSPINHGDNTGSVRAIAFKPNSSDLVIGGRFTSSQNAVDNGSCSGVCIYQMDQRKWVSPRSLNLSSDSEVSSLVFETGNRMLIGGGLKTPDSNNVQVAVYDFGNGTVDELPPLPGTVVDIAVLSNATSRQSYVVAGDSGDSTPFLKYYDSSNRTWNDVPNMPFQSGSEISSLSSVTLNIQGGYNPNAAWPFTNGRSLLVSGNLYVQNGKSVSMVAYDGINWIPMYGTIPLSTSTGSTSAGSYINTVFAQRGGDLKGGVLYSQSRTSTQPQQSPSGSAPSATNGPTRGDHKMAVGHVVGIACAIGICCIIVLTALYLLIEVIVTHGQTDPAYQMLAQSRPSADSVQKDIPKK